MVSAVVGGIIISLIATLIFIVINGLLIWLISKMSKFVDQEPKTAFTVAAIAGVVSFLLSLISTGLGVAGGLALNILFIIVNAAVLIWLLKRYYHLATGKALLTWLIVFVVDFILGFIVGMILALVAIGMGVALI